MKKLLASLLVIPLCGCVVWNGKNITNITETGIGLKASYSGTGITIGLFRAKQTIAPVSTNQLYAARAFDALSHVNTLNPFTFGFDESEGFGDVQVSTNATGQAILPKLAAPQLHQIK